MPPSSPMSTCSRIALLSAAAASLAGAAAAQTANTTVSNVNALNLLSPFLSLNSTPVGQATLRQNLDGSVAVNNNAATSVVIEQTSISDKSLFGGASTSITLPNGTRQAYGPGANLAGGLPAQAVQNGATPGTVTPVQPYGGLGQLGSAFQAAVSPSGAVPAASRLLIDAYAATGSDLGVAKYYFANGTTNGTTAAVAPSGYALPTFNGLPNGANSVYDQAYGVSNTQPNQNIYGDSRPVQVAPGRINGYDPNALTGLAGNPSFPSGHTTYAYTDGILTGMLVPQNFQSMLLRASEYGNSRIDLGVHYALDIVASRSFVSYDLANLLNANPGYTATGLPAEFAAAQPALSTYLAGQSSACGGSVAACAAGNPYNGYSLSTYAANTPTAAQAPTSNSGIYAARMTYGMPTLSAAAAPAEAPPAGGPDASILLATLYGGSTAAARTLAPGGGIYGTLSTATVNGIIANTEGTALAAFAGTPLSYWSRLNLFDAAGYLGNVNGSLTLAAGDQVTTDVTVAGGGTLRGPGATLGTAASPNTVTVAAGGVLSPGTVGETAGGTLSVNGSLVNAPGGTLQFRVAGARPGLYDHLAVTGALALDGILDFELDGFGLGYGLSTFDLIDFGSVSGDFAGLTFDSIACSAAGTGLWSCGNGVTIGELFTPGSFLLQVTNVPEPASLALLGTGALGLIAAGRRRRRHDPAA